MAKNKPGSWFSRWAEEHGVPLWTPWAIAIGLGILVFLALRGCGTI